MVSLYDKCWVVAAVGDITNIKGSFKSTSNFNYFNSSAAIIMLKIYVFCYPYQTDIKIIAYLLLCPISHQIFSFVSYLK